MSEKEEKPNIENIMKLIGEAWGETRDHFGDDFPFESELPFTIKDKDKKIKGKGVIKLGEDE